MGAKRIRSHWRSRPAGLQRRFVRQTGIALIAVLWLTTLLTVIAGGFAYSMRSEALAARNALSLSQARQAADGAVARMAFELQRPRTQGDVWLADGTSHSWQDGDATIVVAAVDESAKIDLNTAAEPLLKGLLQNVGGLDAEAAQRLVDAIADWKDPDEERRPNGAEAPEYKAAGLKYVPTNAPFDTVGDLQRVLGMTPALFGKIAGTLTVQSRIPGVNPQMAARDVLLAFPGATPEAVDAYIAQRDEARANKLSSPAFPLAQAFGSGAISVWRISAEARMPDGVTFVRDAVVRTTPDPRRPLITLLWQEGARAAPAAAEKTAGPTGDAVNTDGKRIQ